MSKDMWVFFHPKLHVTKTTDLGPTSWVKLNLSPSMSAAGRFSTKLGAIHDLVLCMIYIHDYVDSLAV